MERLILFSFIYFAFIQFDVKYFVKFKQPLGAKSLSPSVSAISCWNRSGK